MNSSRNLALVLFFAGLAALEIAHGVFRLETVEGRQRRDLLERIERSYRDLGAELRRALSDTGEHVAYLASLPSVPGILASPHDPAPRAELRTQLLSYLLSFRGSDRVRILDAEGRELFRCERIGRAACVLPASRLATEPDVAMLTLVRDPPRGEFGMSPLVVDHDRVEVPESDRYVLHYAVKLDAGENVRGVLVLTVYMLPLLRAVHRFEPLEGVSALLVDGSGRFVDRTRSSREHTMAPRPTASLYDEHVQAASRLLSGTERVELEDLTYLGLRVHERPPWVLVCRVPESALENASRHLGGEYAWIVGSTLALTSILALAAVFLVRMSVRESRLREQSRYLDRLQKESEKYRALMDGAADMILIVDPSSGRIRESNAMARELMSLPPAEEPARLDAVLTPEALETLERAVPDALAGRRVPLPDLRVRARDGGELDVGARIAAIDLEDERVIQLSLRDLARQKELERRLRISERLGSLGLLTAGVAHEINNPLEGIGNYLALLERESSTPEARERYLGLVRHGFDRIRDIVRDLASFARERESAGTADLAQVVRRALSLMQYSARAGDVEVRLLGLDEPVLVAGDGGRLEQVFLNLCLNACAATGGRGNVTVEARRLPDVAEPLSSAGGAVVEVFVDDDGPGIPEEDLTRIFDPFFSRSTERESSLGLGLFISYGIVDAHDGAMWAENRREGGARFVIRLPAADGLASGGHRDGAKARDTVIRREGTPLDDATAHDSRRR